MSDFDFTVYLSNRNSKDIYKDNTVTAFTNNINPPIILDDSYKWEVALTSCLLGYEPFPLNNYIKKSFKITITTDKVINIRENSALKRDIDTVTIDYPSHLFFNKTPEKIYKDIIEYIRLKINKAASYVRNFLGIHDDHIILTTRTSKTIMSSGPFTNLIKLTMDLNKNMQNLLGLNDSKYTLFEKNTNSSGIPKTIIGNKRISLHAEQPTYIMIYSDIIQPSRFGSQFINVLDIVPFGSSISIDRKLNKISYKNLNKNIINDISILIQDPTFNLMENESDDCMISIHFRKKKPFI